MSLAWLSALVGAAAAAGVIACTQGDDFLPRYGNATGLGAYSPGDAAVSQAVTTADGAVIVSSCVAGSTPSLYVDAGPCTVSFKNDIEPLMSSPGGWDCTNSSCHGGVDAPSLTGNAANDYPTLTSYTTNLPRVYVNPCSTDPDQSSISCNITTTGSSCDGEQGMPETIGTNTSPASAAQVAMLTAWLACGAPNN